MKTIFKITELLLHYLLPTTFIVVAWFMKHNETTYGVFLFMGLLLLILAVLNTINLIREA